MTDQRTEQGITGASVDAIELLLRQHREVEQLWRQMQVSHDNGSEDQTRLGEAIVKMLSQHDAIETQLLYPELRTSAGEEGQKKSSHGLEEHQEVRELLSAIDGKDFRDETIFLTLSRCMDSVQHHVEEEEQKVFPLLRQHSDPPRLMDLGRQMEEILKIAPTHPHPHMPDSKVGAAVAGAVSGVMDRARDAMGSRGKS